MTMLYFEDGTHEIILNPELDFRRVIEEKLGKDSADLYDEILDDARIEDEGSASSTLDDIEKDILSVIGRTQESNFDVTKFLWGLIAKIDA